MTPKDIVKQLNALIGAWIRVGLSENQNHPAEHRDRSGLVEITFNGAERITAALKNQPYKTIYDELLRYNAYSIRMPDGALIQIAYRFLGNELTGHRLAFFPSPYLEDFQNDPQPMNCSPTSWQKTWFRSRCALILIAMTADLKRCIIPNHT